MKGLDSFLSLKSVFKSHACKASCTASQNHCIKKLETHMADRKGSLNCARENLLFIEDFN